MSFKNILIIGLGLVGGSLAKALKNIDKKQKIGAFDQDQQTIESALNQNIIDYSLDLSKNLDQEIDLIVICTPLSTYQEIFQKIGNITSSSTTIIDFGSVKNFKIPKNINNFIPCHPISGSHLCGFENSNENLFSNKIMIICDQKKFLENNNLSKLFETLLLNCHFMNSKEHDEIFALTSHLPQFLSFLLQQITTKIDKIELNNPLSKSLRLDNSDPKIWQDIFKSNEKNIEHYYLQFFDNLERNIDDLGKNLDFLNKIDLFYQKNQGYFAKDNLDQQFFFDNFVTLFFRAIFAISLLEIKDVEKFSIFIGSGFKDFISIIRIAEINQEQLKILTKNNLSALQKNFKKLVA